MDLYYVNELTLMRHMMRFHILLSLWGVTSWLCIDTIPEIAKTKASKPKRYSLSKLRFCHAPLKQLIQARPHMSTSWCGNICIMPLKCSHKERRRGFSNCSSVEAAVSGRRCVFLGKSKSTLFGLLESRCIKESLRLLTTEQQCNLLTTVSWT